MILKPYTELIQNLPVQQQAFSTKRDTWKKAEGNFPWLKTLNDTLFKDQTTLSISRNEIFETKDIKEIIVKTIYWGYTGGMRGNNFEEIISKIEKIESILNRVKAISNPNSKDYFSLINEIDSIHGLGISTLSKILYFLGVKFEKEACIILDSRIIDVLKNNVFIEFESLKNINYSNADKNYLNYLKSMGNLAKSLNTATENIEQFLFIFGAHLKPSVLSENHFTNMWDGYCPECSLTGKTSRMRLNQSDFFECEVCQLQHCVFGVQAVILNFRGNGKYRTTETYGHEVETGEIISPQNTNSPPFNNPTTVFENFKDFYSYILGIK